MKEVTINKKRQEKTKLLYQSLWYLPHHGGNECSAEVSQEFRWPGFVVDDRQDLVYQVYAQDVGCPLSLKIIIIYATGKRCLDMSEKVLIVFVAKDRRIYRVNFEDSYSE